MIGHILGADYTVLHLTNSECVSPLLDHVMANLSRVGNLGLYYRSGTPNFEGRVP
jgi:hypothetical protein